VMITHRFLSDHRMPNEWGQSKGSE
jgi:hypothetical protein